MNVIVRAGIRTRHTNLAMALISRKPNQLSGGFNCTHSGGDLNRVLPFGIVLPEGCFLNNGQHVYVLVDILKQFNFIISVWLHIFTYRCICMYINLTQIQITLGRATRDHQIDVDLSLEGPAWKISRKQGIIKLRNNGEFYIANEGKRPIYIDGKPVLSGNKQKLNNNSVVEVCDFVDFFKT